MSKTVPTPNGKNTVKQFSEAQFQEMADRVMNEKTGKGADSEIEFALSDAQELAAFLRDVAYGTGLAQSTDGAAPTFNTATAWHGFAQVQGLLVEKLDAISAAFYGE